MAPMFTTETCKLLETLISEHHELYMCLFQEPLKPKHHYLIHYPRIMMKMGPLKYVSCLRFEAKHKEIKQNAKLVTSRQNPPYTLSLKHQLGMTYRFMRNKDFDNRFSKGIGLETDLTQLDNYHSLKNTLPEKINNDFFPISWFQIHGTVYKPSMIIDITTDNTSLFGQIQYILMNADETIYYVYQELKTEAFLPHVHAFEVIKTRTWGCIAHVNLSSIVPNSIHCMADGKYYVPCT